MAEQEYLLKISVVCCPDNLLTQSLHSYVGGIFDPSTKSTTGVNLCSKQIKVDTTNIKLILVDISTDPVFEPNYPNYIGGESAAVFAFSKSNPRFVESVIAHYHEFRRHIPTPAVPIAFIGLYSDSEAVTEADGQSLAQELGADYFEMVATDLLSSSYTCYQP